MDRLTKEEIEIMRSYDPNVEGPLTRKGMRKFQSICDMALQSLSQESVRSEALADMFAMIYEGLLVRDISKDHLNGWAARQIAFVQRLAKNKAALQSPARVAEDESDDAVKFAAHLIATAPESPARVAEGKDVHSTELRK